ncbi:MAG: hypothetical protein SF069_00010 [Phycisphaerae bacterium]|nr:hypothetical protein [Phycisphaerae bacterium]
MTIRRGVLPIVLAAFTAIGIAAAAQPASSSAPASDDSPLVAQDFAFNFDQPAFYELVRRMRANDQLAGSRTEPREVVDWREFLERPSDFRGAAVRIRGVLVRNKDPFALRANPELGLLTQLELTSPQPGLAATVICTDDVGDLAIGDTLEFVARFVMIRSYYADSGRVAHAPLFIAAAPLAAERAAPRSSSSSASRHLPWILASFVLALAAFWVILRRAAKAPIRNSESRLTRIAPPQYPVPGWGDEPPDVIYDATAAPDAAHDVDTKTPPTGEQP